MGGLFIGLVIAVILGVSVAVPVIQNAIDSVSLSTSAETILGLLPLFIGLLLLMAVYKPLSSRL